MTLLDTNILIDLLRNHAGALSFITGLPSPPRISVVSVTEVRAGQRGRNESAAVDRYVDLLKPIEVDLAIAERAGFFRRRYGASHGVGTVDAIIAATADLHGLPLATLNLRHFPMFPGLERPY